MNPLNEDLRRWFKEKWVDISKKDESGRHPPCGRSKSSKRGYPKCRPSVRVSSETPETSGEMTDKEKKSATKQKRKAESKPRRGKKPHMTSHENLKENIRYHIKQLLSEQEEGWSPADDMPPGPHKAFIKRTENDIAEVLAQMRNRVGKHLAAIGKDTRYVTSNNHSASFTPEGFSDEQIPLNNISVTTQHPNVRDGTITFQLSTRMPNPKYNEHFPHYQSKDIGVQLGTGTLNQTGIIAMHSRLSLKDKNHGTLDPEAVRFILTDHLAAPVRHPETGRMMTVGQHHGVESPILESLLFEAKNTPTNPELWSRAKSLARKKFKVYPSAYANGWASKWYKSKGGGWKSLNEDWYEYDVRPGETKESHFDPGNKSFDIKKYIRKLRKKLGVNERLPGEK